MTSKSSKFANDDEPNASDCGGFGPIVGLGGAGRGGGAFLFFGGSAGDGDSGACIGLEPCVGACKMANGSLPKSSLPACKIKQNVK